MLKASLFSQLGYLHAWYLWQDPFQLAVKQMPPSLIFELLKKKLLQKFAGQWYRCEGGGKQTADIDLVRVWTQSSTVTDCGHALILC